MLDMDPVIRDLWADELESGHYAQGAGQLHRSGGDVDVDTFCCLGVLCDLAFKAGAVTRELRFGDYKYGAAGISTFLPEEVMAWAGMDAEMSTAVTIRIGTDDGFQSTNLVDLNDGGVSFAKIAE